MAIRLMSRHHLGHAHNRSILSNVLVVSIKKTPLKPHLDECNHHVCMFV